MLMRLLALPLCILIALLLFVFVFYVLPWWKKTLTQPSEKSEN